jgi:hypothetical protein
MREEETRIKSYFFGVGNIYKHGKDSIQYRVTSQQDLTNVIIPHLDKYLLITQKQADFELFKKVVSPAPPGMHRTPARDVEMINHKEHLTGSLPPPPGA